MDDEPDPIETNRRMWDDLAAIHPDTDFYPVEAGLTIEFLQEYPHAYFQRFADMHEDETGRWWLDSDVQLPQLFSLKAMKR